MDMQNRRILLVEDDKDFLLILADTLRSQGYTVTTAGDGASGLRRFITEGADIVIADVMMPRMDGFSMAREIRKYSSYVPILFLTARSNIEDVEEGFRIGGDDYLKKPFEFRELIVRIRALLQRGAAPQRAANVRYIGKYTLNLSSQTLSYGDREFEISNIEARILDKLSEAPGMPVTASELMIAVWQQDSTSSRNSLHGYIHKLRRMLADDPSIHIINQRGFGYMLSFR